MLFVLILHLNPEYPQFSWCWSTDDLQQMSRKLKIGTHYTSKRYFSAQFIKMNLIFLYEPLWDICNESKPRFIFKINQLVVWQWGKYEKIQLVFAAKEVWLKCTQTTSEKTAVLHWSLLTTNPIVAKHKRCHHTCEKVHGDPGQDSWNEVTESALVLRSDSQLTLTGLSHLNKFHEHF